MKHVLFTRDLGQKLLDQGYSQLIISRTEIDHVVHSSDARLTLAPVADLQSKALPIKQMMELPEDKLLKIFVLYKD